MKLITVGLKISQWSGRKFDRKATNEVNQNHATYNSGRFNKLLVNSPTLKAISSVANEIRTYFYENTCEYSMTSERALHPSHFVEFNDHMEKLIGEFNAKVETFCDEYDKAKDEAKARLKSLYNDSDYPSRLDIRGKFGVLKAFGVIEEVQVPDDPIFAQLAQEVRAELNEKHNRSVTDLLGRAKDAIQRIVTTLGEGKDPAKGFGNTMCTDIEKLVNLFPKLNYMNDPKITRITNELKSLVIDADNLRGDRTAQDNYRDRAKRLEKLFF